MSRKQWSVAGAVSKWERRYTRAKSAWYILRRRGLVRAAYWVGRVGHKHAGPFDSFAEAEACWVVMQGGYDDAGL